MTFLPNEQFLNNEIIYKLRRMQPFIAERFGMKYSFDIFFKNSIEFYMENIRVFLYFEYYEYSSNFEKFVAFIYLKYPTMNVTFKSANENPIKAIQKALSDAHSWSSNITECLNYHLDKYHKTRNK